MQSDELTLNIYQAEAAETLQFDIGTIESKMISMLGLAGEVGELATEYKKSLRDKTSYKIFNEKLSEELGDLLWYLSSIATHEDILLGDVALHNLRKIKDRWEDLNQASQLGFDRQLFDDGLDDSEQFPRAFTLEFKHVVLSDGKKYLRVMCNGRGFGNELRDNAYQDDNYRFHDIFHFAYVVVLGWSPVVRKMLKRKRGSNLIVDEVEDGGRATVIDEGISIMIFEYARNYNFFDGVDSVDYSLLRTIKNMVRHLEVQSCTTKEWEDAILLGFSMWRMLRDRQQGTVICDLYEKSMVFEDS